MTFVMSWHHWVKNWRDLLFHKQDQTQCTLSGGTLPKTRSDDFRSPSGSSVLCYPFLHMPLVRFQDPSTKVDDRRAPAASCPFCTVAWCGLRCAKCGGQTMQRDELEPYHMFEKRRCNRMACCGVDIHPHCKIWLSSCPGCGVSPSQMTAEIFVFLRRMALGYEAKWKAICISKMFYSYGIPLFKL